MASTFLNGFIIENLLAKTKVNFITPEAKSMHDMFEIVVIVFAVLSFLLYRFVFTKARINQYFIGCVLCWTLNESIVLFGFILALSSQNPQFYWPFMLVTFVLNVLMVPKERFVNEQMSADLARAERQQDPGKN